MHTFLDERDRLEIDNRIKKASSKSIVVGKAGSVVNVTDGANDVLKGLRVFGKTEQKPFTGKNLCRVTVEDGRVYQGVTFTVNADRSITLNGTPTQDIYLDIGLALLEGGVNYIISGCPKYEDKNKIAFYVNSSVLTGNQWNRETETVFAMPDTKEYICTIQIKAGVVLTNLTFYPMIRLASITDDTYEPCIDSPSPEYPQELNMYGGDGNIEVGVYTDNLFPYPYVKKTHNTVGVTFEEINGRITINGSPTSLGCDYYIYGSKEDNGKYIYFPKGEYEMSLSPINDSFDGNDEFMAFRTLERGTIIGDLTYITSKLKETGLHIFGIFVRAGNIGKTYNNVILQPVFTINKNSAFKDRFEGDNQYLSISTPNGLPAVPVTDVSLATYTDENGQMWCTDEVDLDRGVYIQRVGIEVLTTLSMHEETSDYPGRFVRFLTLNNRYLNGTSPVVSNKFYFGGWGLATNNKWVISLSNSMLYIAPPKGSGYTVDALNVCLAENISADNPLIIAAILETPIETPLSEEEITKYKALHTNYPNTTILNDSNAHMEVKYTADIKNHIEQNYVSKEAAETLLSRVSNIEKHMV